ncbi:hypothetical protein M407DRAFT_216935 [Tulasnella calospora MUT 4182]|uniref:Uncharacterized protein n=1 Tax=Tulasnella calospora MUT 4182 TaxID=1051891 RepID=A0A0C3QAX0_9AGAM|nr:hypothetical protein M407DRAFT_216935 [Tulasnella calospora MUT 4182]
MYRLARSISRQKEETEAYCYCAIAVAAVIEQQKVEPPTKDKKLLKGDFIACAEQMLEVLFTDLFVDITDIAMEDVVHESYGSPVAGPSGSWEWTLLIKALGTT